MGKLLAIPSVVILIITNLIPLYGAIFLGWNVFSILLLYWLENVIIGFETILKMIKAEGKGLAQKFGSITINGQPVQLENGKPVVHQSKDGRIIIHQMSFKGFHSSGKNFSAATAQTVMKSFFIPFFMMHYGLFTLVHGIFLFAFFFSSEIYLTGIILAFLSLCFSHGASYHLNFIQKGEYKTTSSEGLFIAPYPRIIVMHLTIVIGAGFALVSQSVVALVLMIVLKIIVDVASHLFEHRKSFFNGWHIKINTA